MSRLTCLAVVFACCNSAVATAADADKEPMRTAQEDRACAGVTNESTKMRELRRELGAYFGQTVPEELQNRMRKHIEQVGRAKAECDRQREQAVLSK